MQIRFDTLAYLDYDHSFAGSRLSVDGELRLHQREPVVVQGGLQMLYPRDHERLLNTK